MDLMKIVSSPWVLGGGVLLGLLFLLGNRSTPDAPTAYVSNSNQAGLDYAAHSADVAASVAISNVQARTQDHVAILSFLSNIANVHADVAKNHEAVNAGIISTQLASKTAIALDQSNQAERYKEAFLSSTAATTLSQLDYKKSVDLAKISSSTATTLGQQDVNRSLALSKEAGYVAVKTATLASDAQVTTAKYQSDASVSIADKQFWSNIWDNVFGIVPKILKL